MCKVVFFLLHSKATMGQEERHYPTILISNSRFSRGVSKKGGKREGTKSEKIHHSRNNQMGTLLAKADIDLPPVARSYSICVGGGGYIAGIVSVLTLPGRGRFDDSPPPPSARDPSGKPISFPSQLR